MGLNIWDWCGRASSMTGLDAIAQGSFEFGEWIDSNENAIRILSSQWHRIDSFRARSVFAGGLGWSKSTQTRRDRLTLLRRKALVDSSLYVRLAAVSALLQLEDGSGVARKILFDRQKREDSEIVRSSIEDALSELKYHE